MSKAPRHGGERESLLQGVARSVRDAWNGDMALLVVLGLGALLWPWLGWVAAACYVAAVSVVVTTVWLARRRG